MKHFYSVFIVTPKPLLEPKHFPLVTFFSFPLQATYPLLLLQGQSPPYYPSKINGYELFNGSHLFGHMSHEEVYILL